MSRVSDSQIESAWNTVNKASASMDALSELMARFGENQPAVVEFISEASTHWETDAADLAFHAALVIWLAFSETHPTPKRVLSEHLIRHYEQNAQWLDEQRGDAVLFQKKMLDLSKFAEPEVMRYMMELIFEAHEDGLEIEPAEQQQLLLVLKTVADSLA